MFSYIMLHVLGCVKKGGCQKKGGVQKFFFNVLSQEGGQGPGQAPNQLQNRKGCKADPPPGVTGEGTFVFCFVFSRKKWFTRRFRRFWVDLIFCLLTKSSTLAHCGGHTVPPMDISSWL